MHRREEKRKMSESQQQHFVDLRDNTGFGFDPKSWLSGDDPSSLTRTLSSLSAAAATATTASGNVDRALFNDLVEIVPLVQSLIDRKENTAFTRRGSMICTKTPSGESLYKKTAGRSALLTKKQREEKHKNAGSNQDGGAENFSIFSSRSLLSEKDREELMASRDQVEDLKRQISEKDELLKSAELSKSEMASICIKFDELKNEAAEKDSLIKSTQLQLSDAKIKLADKQAAFEKIQWEAMTSSKKAEKLEQDLEMAEREISSFMLLIEGLTRNESSISTGDSDFVLCSFEENHELDSFKDVEMQKLEEAREAYISAVAAAKTKQDEESIAAAATARFYLQSLILKFEP